MTVRPPGSVSVVVTEVPGEVVVVSRVEPLPEFWLEFRLEFWLEFWFKVWLEFWIVLPDSTPLP